MCSCVSVIVELYSLVFLCESLVGYTDLPSRLPTQASTLYANNISKFLMSIGEKGHFNINLEDEVVRGSIILHEVHHTFLHERIDSSCTLCELLTNVVSCYYYVVRVS